MALIKYGYTPFAHIFSFLIIAGTISTANSGLYATIRTLLVLCQKGMGPPFLTQINRHGVPVHATIATLIVVWGLLLISCFIPAHQLYANLLATSGFTGSICWISICWAQLRFRKQLYRNNLKKQQLSKKPHQQPDLGAATSAENLEVGENQNIGIKPTHPTNDPSVPLTIKAYDASLTYKVPLFPYITYFSIWVQVGDALHCLIQPKLTVFLLFWRASVSCADGVIQEIESTLETV